MTPNEYQKLALKTCNDGRLEGLMGAVDARLLHAAIGICTEVGELQDALKKDFIYRKDYDTANIIEEFGDILWYVAVGLDGLGVTLEEAMEKNIAKLRARYGEKFTQEAALNRDLEKEREALK